MPAATGDGHHAGRILTQQSFRRGLRTGSVSIKDNSGHASSSGAKNSVHGGRTGLSFTDDIDSSGEVCIRKGVINRIAEESNPISDDPLNSTVSSSLQSKAAPSGVAIPPKLDHVMFVDVDADDHFVPDDDMSYSHLDTRETRLTCETSPYGDDHYSHEVLSESSEDDASSIKNVTSDSRAPIMFYDSTKASQHLQSRLNAIKDEVASLRQNLESYRKAAQVHRETPDQYKSIMQSVRTNLELFAILTEEARALGGLRHAKHGLVLESLQKLYEHQKDLADSNYCVYHWFLCDLLRIGGVTCDYSCGYLDETDDYGVDISQQVKRDFDKRLPQLHDIVSRLKEAVVGATGDAHTTPHDRLSLLFTVELPSELRGLYPIVSMVPPETNVLSDVVDRYTDITSALSSFQRLKESHQDHFEQLNISERLKSVYDLYVLMDLVQWDPLAAHSIDNELRQRPWFSFVKRFCPEVLPQLVLDRIVPHCVKAIDSWNIMDASQSQALCGFLVQTIENLPPDDRGSVIEMLTSTFLKVVESRIDVLCPSRFNSAFTDGYISGYYKFFILGIASNLMHFSNIFTAATLGNSVFNQLFLGRLVPTVDRHELLDAYVVVQFFRLTSPISPQLRVKNATNSRIRDIVCDIGKVDWTDGCGISRLLDRLGISVTKSNFLDMASLFPA
ncbi:GC-rich sequence DNA-binding factor 2, putative [Babesia ovis]|uniref:GC-rich sequence DNA-binding factor 2, putative n=1 Tax=Babesia ovis TaxID=5869 RepID=A0A9W5T8K0_BABOV|nr:GC-rich sequence DNA-binding factor 2, putative [Babesia ovis]